MEVVIKKITLNDFKNYDPNVKLKCINDCEYCWNEMPMDLIVTEPKLTSVTQLPFVEVDNKKVLRYYNIKKLSYLIHLYENSMIFYHLIKIKNNKKWVKCEKPEGFDYNLVFIKLPEVSEYDCGAYIATNKYKEEYDKYFKDVPNETIGLLKKLFGNYFKNNISPTSYSEPFINVPLFISTSLNDCGDMLNELQRWEKNKIYYDSDIVFHIDSYYICECKEKNEKDFVQEKKFNETNSWRRLDFPTSTNVELVDLPNYEDSEYYTESKLDVFLSQRKTYSDDGELMEFVVIACGGRNVCLKYKGGYINRRTANNITYIDELLSVEFGDDENNWYKIEYSNGSGVELDYYYIIFNNGYVKINDKTINSFNKIKFTYIIGAQIDSDENIIENSGIKYEEIRECSFHKKNFKIEEREEEYCFCKIEPLSLYSLENNFKKPYARLLSLKLDDNYDNFTYTVFNTSLYDDRLLGTSYVDVDIPKISVDRGSYTAMERHYILGEVNSFDDLEKYRNNIFKL